MCTINLVYFSPFDCCSNMFHYQFVENLTRNLLIKKNLFLMSKNSGEICKILRGPFILVHPLYEKSTSSFTNKVLWNIHIIWWLSNLVLIDSYNSKYCMLFCFFTEIWYESSCQMETFCSNEIQTLIACFLQIVPWSFFVKKLMQKHLFYYFLQSVA